MKLDPYHNPDVSSEIKEVVRYQTTDGENHFSKEGAERHQKELHEADYANEKLKYGYSIAEIFRAIGKTVTDPILESITKDSKFVISHWQCRDNPGYQPCYFSRGLLIYVGGNAGSWSGFYGNHMPISEMIRYAKHRDSLLNPPQPTNDDDK